MLCSAYTLRGIASFDPNHNSIDMNKYLNNFEVPKNRSITCQMRRRIAFAKSYPLLYV